MPEFVLKYSIASAGLGMTQCESPALYSLKLFSQESSPVAILFGNVLAQSPNAGSRHGASHNATPEGSDMKVCLWSIVQYCVQELGQDVDPVYTRRAQMHTILSIL